MNIGKVLKISSIILVVLSALCLALPLFSTYIEEGESAKIVIHLYNLAELSPLGSIVLLTPIILLGLILSEMKNQIKTIGAMGLVMLDWVALSGSTSAAYSWITERSTGFVQGSAYEIIYALLILLAATCCYVSFNFCTDKESVAEMDD